MNQAATIEEALKELREMFPDAKAVTISGDYINHWNGDTSMSTRILVTENWRSGHGRFFTTNPTLEEAMAEVRAWKASQ
jgi:hypothetical protein